MDRTLRRAIASVPQDVRHGIRSLARMPGFTAAAVLTIGLGIAANTAIFSVVNAALVRSLPYDRPDRLMQVAERNDKLHLPYFSASALNYLSWKERTRTFTDLGAFGSATYTLTGRGEPEQVTGGPISASLVPLLGLRPVAGRAFRDGEDALGGPPVVIISEALWRRRFGGDRGAINRPMTVDGVVRTLVGVMGPELNTLAGGDLWVPMAIDQAHENRLSHVIDVVGRLRPGVTMETAQSEMDAISRQVVEQYPDVRDWTIRIRSLSNWFVSDQLRTALLMLMGAVGLVLVIVCANVANLLLSRGVVRQKEFAIRAALGASRGRLVWQLLVEGLLLSLAGGVVGLLLASGAVTLFNALPPNQQPVTGVRIDATVLIFTFAASLFAAALFGLAPALHGSRADLNVVLKDAGRGTPGSARSKVRGAHAALQLALATVLVIGAGLLSRSLLNLERVPLGFAASNVLTFRLAPPAASYPTHASAWAFYKRLMASLESIPGVRAVAISSGLPFGAGAYTRTPVSTPNRSVLPAGTAVPVDWRVVSPGYFRTFGIPLIEGRDFTDQDTPESAPVMVVSRGLARRFWGHDDPLGKVLHLVNARGKARADYTVVGVVGDVRAITLNDELPAMYYSSSFRIWPSMEVAVRTAAAPEAILPTVRQRLRASDPELPMAAVQTVEQGIAGSVSQPRFNATLLLVFALVAAIIAAIGIYGVLAYSVSSRSHEIGLRMALGADRRTVMGLVVGEGMAVSLAGTGLGVLGAIALSRTVASLLFGIDARDPVTFVVGALGVACVALVACVVPAWRASRVDPVVALRGE